MNPHQLETRAFHAPTEDRGTLSDIQRVVAWAGLDRPQFMNPDSTPREAARDFLNTLGDDARYLAVIDRNPETGIRCVEEEFRGGPRRTTILGGPIACLRQDFNGEVACVYVDPAFRDRPALVNAIDNLVARANNRPPVPMPTPARLVVAA